MDTPRDRWGSQLGFVLATIGFAIGLGNIWRFPYLTGENGGGAFLLIYLLLAVVIGIPLFTAEISLGRNAQKSPAAGMRALAGERSPWRIIGWLGIGAAFLIMAYYQIIMGWIAAHLVRAFGSGYSETDPAALSAAFDAFTARPGPVLAYTAVVMVLVGLIVSRGLREGIERSAKFLIPVLFVFLIGLAIVGLQFEGSSAGLRWLFVPDFSAVNAATWLAALGQVFYSIGVGMAGAFVFGSYLDPANSDVPGNAAKIVAFDTIAAVLAGVVIFPALFAFGLEPDTGPGLLFVTMSGLFARLPAGDLAAGAFFFLVFVAGLTSCLALIETLTGTFMDTFGWSRPKSVWSLLVLLYAGGIVIALGFGPWRHIQVAGRGFFGLADYVSGNVFLTLGGLAISLYVGISWGFERFREDTNRGAGRFRVTAWWGPVMRFIAPVAVALVLLAGLGILG
ncbi:MAG: sodium-dependent transporter [Gemmatimonadota bacterium]